MLNANVLGGPRRREASDAKIRQQQGERDLFGRVVLVRRWGRLGTFGKVRLHLPERVARGNDGIGVLSVSDSERPRHSFKHVRARPR
jgi:hypothetical protein